MVILGLKVHLAFGKTLEADLTEVLVRSVISPSALLSLVLASFYDIFAFWTWGRFIWPVDRACSRLGSLFSRLAMFSRLLPGCLTPTCRQRRHNYICQATCPGCPLFPGCPAAQCSLFSRLLPSRLFTRHYPLGR